MTWFLVVTMLTLNGEPQYENYGVYKTQAECVAGMRAYLNSENNTNDNIKGIECVQGGTQL